VQAIIRELRGEKIDIVEWSDDPVLFVTNALSPAKVQRVTIVDDKDRVMEVVVEDKQLSLAIGKKGQNVRLAAKLTGWRIDIKSEEEKRREVEAQFGALEVGEPAQQGEGQPSEGEEQPSGELSTEAGEPGDEGELAQVEAAEESEGATEEAREAGDAEEPEVAQADLSAVANEAGDDTEFANVEAESKE
jgi:hypothetical protein